MQHICSIGLGLSLGLFVTRNRHKHSQAPDAHAHERSTACPTGYAPKEFQEMVAAAHPNPNPLGTTLFNTIQQRRSIFPKDFTGEIVPVHVVEECLAAANWAPTHGKTQPWRFTVIANNSEAMARFASFRDAYMETTLDGDKLDKYRKKMLRKQKAMKNTTYTIFIMVKAVTTASGRRMKQWEEIAATAMAVQNFHLQLTCHWESGYGGYWSSGGAETYLKDSKEIRQMLGAVNAAGEENDGVDDLVLGAFYVGHCLPSKMNKYRSSRGDISEKVKWIRD